jgi:hypothetical protein
MCKRTQIWLPPLANNILVLINVPEAELPQRVELLAYGGKVVGVVDHGRDVNLGVQAVHVAHEAGRIEQVVEELDALVEAVLAVDEPLEAVLVRVVGQLALELVKQAPHERRGRGVEEARVEGRVVDAAELVLGEQDLSERVEHQELQVLYDVRIQKHNVQVGEEKCAVVQEKLMPKVDSSFIGEEKKKANKMSNR